MAIIGIVCVDKNWGIGKDNHLLFNIPEDMEFFRKNTSDQIVCMGYNTLLSLPDSKPLKHRLNIVLCPEGINIDNCISVHSLEALISFINTYIDSKDIYIIGGGMLYQSMLPYYDKVLVTKVNADKDADTFFPNLDNLNEFTISASSSIINFGKYTDNYDIQFIEYKRL